MPSPTRRVPGLRRAPLRPPLHALLVARLLSHGSRAPSRAAPALPARTPRRPPPLPRDPLAGSLLRPELHALGADCLPPSRRRPPYVPYCSNVQDFLFSPTPCCRRFLGFPAPPTLLPVPLQLSSLLAAVRKSPVGVFFDMDFEISSTRKGL